MTDEEIGKLNDGELIESFGDEAPVSNMPAKKKRMWSVSPYVNLRDFNNQGKDEFHCEDNPSHSGVEVGLRFTF